MDNSIKAIVFDMDGLMFDTEPLYMYAWQTAAWELGHQISDQLFHNLIGKNNTDCENIVIKALGNHFPVIKFRALWPEKWREKINSSGIPLKIGLLELLDFLDSRNIPYGLATSSDWEDAQFALHATGMLKRFKCIITSSQVKRGKPAPDIYLKATEELGVSPSLCFALEDSNFGAKAAISAGIRTIVVPDIIQPTEEVVSSSYAVVSSLIEARAIIEDLLPE